MNKIQRESEVELPLTEVGVLELDTWRKNNWTKLKVKKVSIETIS